MKKFNLFIIPHRKKIIWKIENAVYIFAAVLLSDAYQERQRVMAQ